MGSNSLLYRLNQVNQFFIFYFGSQLVIYLVITNVKSKKKVSMKMKYINEILGPVCDLPLNSTAKLAQIYQNWAWIFLDFHGLKRWITLISMPSHFLWLLFCLTLEWLASFGLDILKKRLFSYNIFVSLCFCLRKCSRTIWY